MQTRGDRFVRHGRDAPWRGGSERAGASGAESDGVSAASHEPAHLLLPVFELRSLSGGKGLLRRRPAGLFERIRQAFPERKTSLDFSDTSSPAGLCGNNSTRQISVFAARGRE